MDLAGHEKSCVKTFGNPFSEVHLFLDSFSRKYRGFSHRVLLHHSLGVELCVKKFGCQAGAAAIQHIMDEMGMVAGCWEEVETNYYPMLDDEALQYQDMIDLHGEEAVKKFKSNTKIALRNYPELRLISWDRPGDAAVTEFDAFCLYKSRWKYVYEDYLAKDELSFIERLKAAYGYF
jgi:hypothetical protein